MHECACHKELEAKVSQDYTTQVSVMNGKQLLRLTRGSRTVGGTRGGISCTNTTRLSATAFQLSGPHEQMSADQVDMQ